MTGHAKQKRWLRKVLLVSAALILITACSLIYSLNAIKNVRNDGIYTSPQDGITRRAYRNFTGVSRIDIQTARVNADNGSNPHVWYTVYQIYAQSRADGSPLNHNADHVNGGSYYMHMKDGWVYVPDVYMPEMIGFWMKVLGWAGT